MSIPLVSEASSAQIPFSQTSEKPSWLAVAQKVATAVLPVLAMATFAFVIAPEAFYASVMPTAFFAVGVALATIAAFSNNSVQFSDRVQEPDPTEETLNELRDDLAEERAETAERAKEVEKKLEELSRRNMLNPEEVHAGVEIRP